MAQQVLLALLKGQQRLLARQRALLPLLQHAVVSCAKPQACGMGIPCPMPPACSFSTKSDEDADRPAKPGIPHVPLGRVPAACAPTVPSNITPPTTAQRPAAADAADASAGDQPATPVGPQGSEHSNYPDSISSKAGPPGPWDLVANLPRSSKYQVPALCSAPLSTYISYLAAARQGMMSVLDMGVVRQDGQEAREQLAQRELVLGQLVELFPACGQDDDALSELTTQQLQQVATAAGVEADAAAVENLIMDYFVAKRCWELMELQRQMRRALQEQQQQQQVHQHPPPPPSADATPRLGRRRKQPHRQQQQQPLPSPSDGSPDPAAGADNDLPQIHASMSLEQQLAAVFAMPIWDVFHDAELDDYLTYIQAALDGAPSIFLPFGNAQFELTAGADPSNPQHQELLHVRQKMKGALRILRALSPQQRSRPLLHIGAEDLSRLATKAGVPEEDVRGVLEDFYKLKRLGFALALEALTGAMAQDDSGDDQ